MGSSKKRKLPHDFADLSSNNTDLKRRSIACSAANRSTKTRETIPQDGNALTSGFQAQRKTEARNVSGPTYLESPASDPIRSHESKWKRKRQKRKHATAAASVTWTSSHGVDASRSTAMSSPYLEPGMPCQVPSLRLEVHEAALTRLARPPAKRWIVALNGSAVPLGDHSQTSSGLAVGKFKTHRHDSQQEDGYAIRGPENITTSNSSAQTPTLDAEIVQPTTTPKSISGTIAIKSVQGVCDHVHSRNTSRDLHESDSRSSESTATNRPSSLITNTYDIEAMRAYEVPFPKAGHVREADTISVTTITKPSMRPHGSAMGPGARGLNGSARPSIGGGTIQVKSSRGMQADLIPDYSLMSTSLKADRQLFHTLPGAIDSSSSKADDSSSDENSVVDDEKLEEHKHLRGSFCESFAHVIFADTPSASPSPSEVANDVEASSKIEYSDENGPAEETAVQVKSDLGLSPSTDLSRPHATSQANHVSHEQLDDMTSSGDVQRFTESVEPELPSLRSATSETSESSVSDDEHDDLEASTTTRESARASPIKRRDGITDSVLLRTSEHDAGQRCLDIIAADEQLQAEALLPYFHSESRPSSSREAAIDLRQGETPQPTTQEGIAADPQARMSNFADFDEGTPLRTDLGGRLFGRGNSFSSMDVKAQISDKDMQASMDEVYDDIDDVTSSVLGESTNAMAMEKCKPHMVTTSANGAGDVLTFGGHRSQTASDPSSLTRKTVEALPDEGRRYQSTISQPSGGSRRGGSVSSDLSELTHTPSPPMSMTDAMRHSRQTFSPQVVVSRKDYDLVRGAALPSKGKRKMTGNSSTHFSASKRAKVKGRKDVLVSTPKTADNTATDEGLASGELDADVFSGQQSVLRAEVQDLTTRASDAFENLATPSRDSGKIAQSDQVQSQTEVEAPPGKAKTRRTASKAKVYNALKGVLKNEAGEEIPITPIVTTPTRTPRSKPRSTGRISEHFIADRVDLYNTTASSRRVPAGVSVAPVPSINEVKFGIIQEEHWNQPFWLLIAVTLLNRTTGRAAVPVFRRILRRYLTADDLANARYEELFDLVKNLGFQNNRTKTLLKIAKTWVETPPVCGTLYRTKDYPNKGDGRAVNVAKVVEEDVPVCAGAIEIGHLYGCGTYAYDSWRIFCRDVLRGVANGYNGQSAKVEDFEPEWKRVVPGDKELRACLRWMWLREGWIWDATTGEKRRATDEEMEKAVAGEMQIEDLQERRFATIAAAGLVSTQTCEDNDALALEVPIVVETPLEKRPQLASQADSLHPEEKRENKLVVSGTASEYIDDDLAIPEVDSSAIAMTLEAGLRPTSTRAVKPHRSIESADHLPNTSAMAATSGSAESEFSRSKSLSEAKSQSGSRDPSRSRATSKKRRDIYDVPITKTRTARK